MPIYKKVNKDFFKKWSPEMAYVLGFFAADGCITVNSRGGEYFVIQISDLDLLKKIKKILESDHKITKRFHLKYSSVFFRIQIGSKEICNDLRKLGFSENKTHHIVVPKIPSNYIGDFIRGYFDGDGNIWQGEVHKERKTSHRVLQLAFTSGSYNFLKQLKMLLGKILKTNGCLVVSKIKAYCRLQFSTKDALKIYDFMYNTDITSLCLKRKKKQFDINIKKLRL